MTTEELIRKIFIDGPGNFVVERMYKICLLVIVLGLEAPVVSWFYLLVQQNVTGPLNKTSPRQAPYFRLSGV